MVNELRTLLLNEPPVPFPGADFEEFIDPAFCGRPLPAAAAAVRAEVFRGGEASLFYRPYRNVVATAISRLAYAGETAKTFAPLLDGRIFLADASLVVPSVSVDASTVSAASALPSGFSFSCGGDFAPPDPAIGALRWQLDAVDDPDGTPGGPPALRISSAIPLAMTTVQTVSFTGSAGLLNLTLTAPFSGDSSLPVLLPAGGGVFVQFVGVASIPAGFRAAVTACRPFVFDALDLLERLRARPEVNALFGLCGEVGSSLAAIYGRPGFPHEQLAAALYAYALAVR